MKDSSVETGVMTLVRTGGRIWSQEDMRMIGQMGCRVRAIPHRPDLIEVAGSSPGYSFAGAIGDYHFAREVRKTT